MSALAISVCTCVATPEEARRIATEVLRQRLAESAQISSVDDFPVGRNGQRPPREYRVELTTTKECSVALEAALRALLPERRPMVRSTSRRGGQAG